MLEELPKWGLLMEIMGEVAAERARLAASDAAADRAAAAAPVLIVARELHTCAQLAKVQRWSRFGPPAFCHSVDHGARSHSGDDTSDPYACEQTEWI